MLFIWLHPSPVQMLLALLVDDACERIRLVDIYTCYDLSRHPFNSDLNTRDLATSLAYHYQQSSYQYQLHTTLKVSHNELKLIHPRRQIHLWVSLSEMDAPDLQQGPEYSQTVSENQTLHHRRR